MSLLRKQTIGRVCLKPHVFADSTRNYTILVTNVSNVTTQGSVLTHVSNEDSSHINLLSIHW